VDTGCLGVVDLSGIHQDGATAADGGEPLRDQFSRPHGSAFRIESLTCQTGLRAALRDPRFNHLIETVRRLHEAAVHEIGEKPLFTAHKAAGVTAQGARRLRPMALDARSPCWSHWRRWRPVQFPKCLPSLPSSTSSTALSEKTKSR
jgi:hypothetical protein